MLSFQYDANGMRTGRSSTSGIEYSYVYNGGQLMQMTRGTTVYQFTYDANGTPMTISENGTVYYYVTNLQGDVMAILNSSGTEVVRYSYDAWGKILSTTGTMASTLGTYNPLRYRGYVYDTETGLYYLQSRYYNPTVGRFINADAFASTGQGILGNNMFAYCGNNPEAFLDVTGTYYASILDRITTDGFTRRAVIPKMILNQHDEGIGNKRLGITTVSHGGCGPVATYNALLTLGDEATFDEVLSYYNKSPNRTVALGLLGTLPHQVTGFFESRGYRVIMSNTHDGIEIFSQTADACILWYAYPQKHFGIDLFNAHFVHYHKYESEYKAYNTQRGISTFNHPYDEGNYGDRYSAIGIFIYK